MCLLNEKSQSLRSYSLPHMCTNVQNLPVVTICQLNPALTVLFTFAKMVGRTGEGTDKCDFWYGSGAWYPTALPPAHLPDAPSQTYSFIYH